MRYRNAKTGAEFESPCVITGGDWEEVDLNEVPEDKIPEKESEEETGDDDIVLSEMTVAQLKDLAKELEIDLGDASRKDDIIAVILASEAASGE